MSEFCERCGFRYEDHNADGSCPIKDQSALEIAERLESEQQTHKRKVGRPANPNRPELQAKRRFIQLEKTPATIELLRLAHEEYERLLGKKGSDAAVIRFALNKLIE